MSALPRLLYFSDVLAEASYSGSLLVYRLLETYPPDRVVAVETSHALSVPARRLPGVAYASIRAGSGRLAFTRFHEWWNLAMTTRSSAWARQARASIGSFQPEAVLSVVHGHAWAAAAAFAHQARLPLHLIVHDDWPRMVSLPWPFRARIDRQLRASYRQAVSRLCVSPWMVEDYAERYGACGQVLYPSRSAGMPAVDAPPDRLRTSRSGLTVALAGTVRAAEHFQLLGTIARAIRNEGGRVLVFGPATSAQGAANGAGEPNIHFEGMLDFDALARRLRAEADAVVVPMSFAHIDAPNMRVSFPSKLVDYTALALPLLIYGPEYASPVRWARHYPGVAEVVTSNRPEDVAAALEALRDPAYRVRIASRAHEVGTQLFSHQAAWSTFTEALRAEPRSTGGVT